MKIAQFLAVALLVTFAVMFALGGWLLPRMGVDGGARTVIAGGVAGALVAGLYFRMIRRPGA